MSTGLRDSDDKPELRFRIKRWSRAAFSEFAEQHKDKDWNDEERGLAFVGSVLITDVEGLEDDDGTPIEWSPEYGLSFFHGVRLVERHEDDEDPEAFRPLEYIADACLAFARSDDVYIGDLSGN